MTQGLICFIFIQAGNVFAQTETDTLYKKHTFELGAEFDYITYAEPGVLKESGIMYGPVASYTYHDKIMLKAEGRLGFGKLNSYALEGAPISENNNPDNMWEFRGLGGYDFAVLKSLIITPFLGVGYRYFSDDVWSRPYEKESRYLYSPIGVGFITGLGKGWSIGGTGEFDLSLVGKTSRSPS